MRKRAKREHGTTLAYGGPVEHALPLRERGFLETTGSEMEPIPSVCIRGQDLVTRGGSIRIMSMLAGFVLSCVTVGVLLFVPAIGQCDENLNTPYVMLDPASMPPPSPMHEPLPRTLSDPTGILRFPSDLGVPNITSSLEKGIEHITLSNAAVAFTVRIDPAQRAVVDSLKASMTGEELLAAPSAVFLGAIGTERITSESYRVSKWRGFQYPDYAELVLDLSREKDGAGPASITWKLRAFRLHPWIEQRFDMDAGDFVFGQVLETKSALRPVMPANLFGRGFSDGKPNIPDRRRFEWVEESEHLCYDPKAEIGLWGFVAEIGGQERIAKGRFSLIQNPSFRTRRDRTLGPFVLQPFHGPAEIGFSQLRDYIQDAYSVQKRTPALFEWNQFWLWQGGPTRVDNSVVTEKRLIDILPGLVKMGLEEFHLDAGWQWHDGDWTLAPDRFPGGWQALRDFNRRCGLAYHTWVNDKSTDSPEFILDLIDKSALSRLFMDRQVSEKTIESVEKVRQVHPGFSTNCHNSTSRSSYWPWGNIHFLSDFNQIYFGEGQLWAWSNILPEANIEPKEDRLYPQRTEAERFFSRHDMGVGDLITRAAAYQAQWVWPFNSVMPPHTSWDWFENRPIEQLRSRAITYLACKFKYEWGFDPARLSAEAIEFQLACTSWFKANRAYLTSYQHVLDAPDGNGIDAAAHFIGQSGFIFLFNPSETEQQVSWREILWEPELQMAGRKATLSDWTGLVSYKPLGQQNLSSPLGGVRLEPHGVRVIGVNLDCDAILKRVLEERSRISSPLPPIASQGS